MRNALTVCALAITFGTVGAQSVIVKSTTPLGSNSPYDTAYNVASQTTVIGTIIGVGSSKPSSNMPENMRLLVQTLGTKPTTYVIELGPDWYVNAQTTKLTLGQWVKVTGSKIRDRHETKILAMVVQLHNHQTLPLRRQDGAPYWADLASAAQPSSATKGTPAIGTILKSGTVMISGVRYPAVTVQTANGPVNMIVPQQQNNFVPESYQVGNNIQFIPSDGYPVVVTGSVNNTPSSVYAPRVGGFYPPILPNIPSFWF